MGGSKNVILCTNTPWKKKLSVEQVEQFIATIADKKRGLIVCGPQPDEGIRSALLGLAEKWHIPILADPLSQMRSASEHSLIIESYDAILKSKEIRQYFKPDFIIRFGAMPISKPYLFFVEEHADAAHFVVEKQSGFRDPVGHATEYIFSDPIYFCEDMQSYELSTDKTWAEQWQHANERAKQVVKESFSGQLTEGKAVHTLIDELPQESTLYVGNSMAIRDVDTFFMKTKKSISVLANRGANGIDGMISSGLGAAASHTRVSLLLGDLSFFHDMNGLLATKHYEIDMTILLINNNGGGIFSFLPQAKNGQHFELLFGTPLHIEFQHAVQMYGGHYSEATSDAELVTALQASYKRKGLSVIEVKTDREENARWHQEIWNGIHDELIQIIGE
ncbi:2-succinyl-5-enolpyruvyl-6-hydroxy-3-cyclohexene-1-carboxylate synthase [Paracerasibacillus soli]|uniref:Thiamine pyrophosphate-dependent enzyme n=1 Tax=Paracerasibacillus soli TaxID=480284 RepID=A0ABU5CQU8_9BACI|nr:thiamine pyrophosphate-dependent enzyme [Virgibacillus soli]MDY0408753.1 thiamine pyrophosphate-dependent enzyme [Virgibacillus soli]